MGSTDYLAASPGEPPLAQQVNQFVTTHPTTYVYTGVEQDHLATAGTGTVASNGVWVAERFTPSVTYATGRIVLTLAASGSPGPLVVGVYADAAGVPGALIAGPVSLAAGFVGASAAAVSIPMPGLAVSSGVSYWIVAQPAGDVSDYFSWSRASGSSGAATSPDGVSWTAQAYNLLFQVWDDTAVLPLVHAWEDSGARWSTLGAYTGTGQPGALQEYTVAQGSGRYLSSAATLAYGGSVLSGVSATGAPVYCAPHNGLLGDASAFAGSGQVNQFLGTHPMQAIYQGDSVLTPNGTGGTAWGQQLSTLDVDQSFTMTGTSIGRVAVPALPVGSGADLLVSLWTDSGGTPATMLNQARIPASWITQLAAVAGVSGPSSQAPTLQYTGRPLATAGLNTLHFGTASFPSWSAPTNGTGGPAGNPVSTYYGNYLIQIGGNSGSTFYNNVFTIGYDENGDIAQAMPQPSLPANTDGSGSAVVQTDPGSGTSTLFMTGGSQVSGSGMVNAVFAAGFNPATGTISSWSTQTVLPVATQYHSTAAWQNHIYVIGGSTGAGVTANVYYAQVQNGQLGSWTAATPLPAPLWALFTVALNGFLFVIGGANPSAAEQDTVYYAPINADGSLGAWLPGPLLPKAMGVLQGQPALAASTYGIAVNGSSTFCTLGVTTDGPDASWQSAPLSAGGNFYAISTGDNGSWRYYGLYGTFYCTSPVALTPRISVPLPTSGLTSGATYHVMLQQQGGDINNYLCTHLDFDAFSGNPTALTSARGAYTWSALTPSGTCVPIQVFDQSAPSSGVPPLPLHLWEDQGARITTIVSATTPDQRPLGVCEATVQPYALNSNAGFQAGIAPWFASGGTVVQSSAEYYEGGFSAQVTPSGVDANVFLGSENMATMPGQSVTVDGWIWCTDAVTGNVSMSINWYDLTGSYISTSSNDVSVAAATWTRLTNTFTAPAGAYQLAIAATVSGTPVAAQVFYVGPVRAYYTYTGPQNATVTQIEWSGTGWPATGIPVGTTQLA